MNAIHVRKKKEIEEKKAYNKEKNKWGKRKK